MDNNRYETVLELTRSCAEKYLESNDVEKICKALVSISIHDVDWEWAQNKCIEFLLKNDVRFSGLAATCLGHIARVHRTIDKEKIYSIISSNLFRNEILGQINDALDDICIYVR